MRKQILDSSLCQIYSIYLQTHQILLVRTVTFQQRHKFSHQTLLFSKILRIILYKTENRMKVLLITSKITTENIFRLITNRILTGSEGWSSWSQTNVDTRFRTASTWNKQFTECHLFLLVIGTCKVKNLIPVPEMYVSWRVSSMSANVLVVCRPMFEPSDPSHPRLSLVSIAWSD